MRRDAVRNREQILAAARLLVGREGRAMSMDALAVQADVAVGTLYRHFPTKLALLAAVVEESVVRIEREARAALDRAVAGSPAGLELERVFRFVAANDHADRAMKDAAKEVGVAAAVNPLGPDSRSSAAAAAAAISDLLAAAQRLGAVDEHVTIADLVMLIAQAPTTDQGQRERYVRFALTGIGLRPA